MIKPEQWHAIEREADMCPVLMTYVQYVKSQHQTREDALVAAAIDLSRMRRELIAERERTARAMLANEESRSTPMTLRLSGG